MKMLTTALLAATAFAVVAPTTSAQAQAYGNCESDRQGRQVAGAIIGGILGAVIGNELADDSNNRPAAITILIAGAITAMTVAMPKKSARLPVPVSAP